MLTFANRFKSKKNMKRLSLLLVICLVAVTVNAQKWMNIKNREGRYVSYEVTPELELSWSKMQNPDSAGTASPFHKKAPNALRLSLKNGKDKEVLFTKLPKVTHSTDGKVVLSDGDEKMEYETTDIRKLCFFYNDGASSLINVYKESPRRSGIYTLSGVKVDKIEKSGYYIINGTIVLVR